MKQCARCRNYKEDDEFNWSYFGVKRQSLCRECTKLQRREHCERHPEAEKKRTYQVSKDQREHTRRFIYEYLSHRVWVDHETAFE